MTSIFVFVYLMRLRAPSSTRTDTLCPYTTIFRSISISTRSILMKIDSKELAAIHAAATRLDIPHSQLRLSEAYQARSAQDRKQDTEILELKATIQAMGGLLQNLVVVAAPDGSYEVCAGGRRWKIGRAHV